MKDKIVAFGEIMLRLTPPDYTTISQARSFVANYGGGEANVLVALSHFGHNTAFITKVPDNQLGDSVVKHLQGHGVNTDYVVRGNSILGLYFVETGFGGRPSKVLYNRKHSAITRIGINEVNYDEIFKDAKWFHLSGITLALGDKVRKVAFKCLEACKKYNVKVSFDFNYRSKLWTSEKAISVMRPLMQYVDVCIGNEEDAELCLGFKPDSDVIGGKTDASGYHKIFEQMMKEFGFKYVVSTLRESYSATHNGWKALIYNGKEFYESKHYDINPIVDRVGGGDSFSGGLIHGLIKFEDQAKALEFAVAASALKHTIPGDFNLVSESEVLALMGGDGSGRVQR